MSVVNENEKWTHLLQECVWAVCELYCQTFLINCLEVPMNWLQGPGSW